MYIRTQKWVNQESVHTDYTQIRNLNFNTATDMASASIPVNDFSADIYTEDFIDIGQFVELRDDANRIWATYWVVSSQFISEGLLRLRCESNIALLDRVELPAIMYHSEPILNVIDSIIPSVLRTSYNVWYYLDTAFENETISGFCPKQTARERLKWVCFVIGAYVRTHFNDSQIDILQIDNTETMIPMNDIYWKPTVTYKDWVTAITIKSYAFENVLDVEAQDTYVEDDNGRLYLVTETTLTLTNPNAPPNAPENMVRIEEMYLINNGNASTVLNRLAQWYFGHKELEFDAINNGDYICGDKLIAYANESQIVKGFLESANFTFGLQAKARMKLTAVQDVTGAKLIINYMYQSIHIGWNEFFFPVGYQYSVTNPYNDLYLNDHLYVYRPLNEACTGTMQSGDNEKTEYYAVALDLYEGVLHIISVDEIEQDVDLSTDTAIGVIS